MRAKKSLGQNFLVDDGVAERIVRALAPRADETVLEIGPGRGALTTRLSERAGRVVALELDRELAAALRVRFSTSARFTLIEGDALDVDFCAVVAPASQARVVANLPYNIATAILQRLITARGCVTESILMLQREVVARLVAPPSTPERGFISVLVEAYCEAEALFDVAPAAFKPVPKVWSTVVRLRMREQGAPDAREATLLWPLVSAGFAQRRKTIFNNLRHAPADLLQRIEQVNGAHAALLAAEIDPQRRAETLTLTDWRRLARMIGQM